MTKRQNDKIAKWPNSQIGPNRAKWQNGTMAKWQNSEMKK